MDLQARHRNLERQQIEKLRAILLEKDREVLEKIQHLLDDQEQLAKHLAPILEDRLDLFQQQFPKAYRQTVEKIVEQKLEQSQAELLDILYPILGKMIRKYIAQQLQDLREGVEQQLKNSFFGRLQAWLKGVKESDIILHHAAALRVQEAFVIEQPAGLLIGNASASETVDKEVLAGMLTAIKMFAVDAFKQAEVELEMIQYGDYQILIHDFYTYYVVLAVKGSLTPNEKQTISEKIMTFAQNEMKYPWNVQDPLFHLHLKEKLNDYFMVSPV
ncbi:MAG TPA: hypothetical protein PKA00_03360 [Saprospiraceae bacterium]|nr:hypothetical protein [Saprospiraceae bacterium]HMQ81914.1 hypothetical protein [Saprospiraceae bacterium]